MIQLEAAIVRNILGGRRTTIRVPAKGKKPKAGHCYEIRGPKDSKLSCKITIASIAEEMDADGPVWVIRFQKGDHRDTARLLAARWQPGAGDYVSDPSRSLRGTADEVSEATQARYAAEGELRHAEILLAQRERALEAIQEIKRHAPTGKARKRLASAEHQIRTLGTETSSKAV